MARDVSLPLPFVGAIPAARAPVTGKLREFFRSLFRPKPAESEIERFVRHNGGVLTDQLEREISRRFGTVVG